MTSGGVMNVAWLGAGGRSPCVDLLNTDSGNSLRLLNLPKGQSIYTIAVSDDLAALAVGTRGGYIHLCGAPCLAPAEPNPTARCLFQGSSLLGICFEDRSHLAAADAAGRCLRWNLDAEASPPIPLESGAGVIVSLLKLPDGRIAGLASDGELRFWRPSNGTGAQTAKVPAPVRSALTMLTYWAAEGAVAYPGENGTLVSYVLDTGAVIVRRAHKGGFLVAILADDDLITIGRHDGVLRVWRAEAIDAVAECRAPVGVVSAFGSCVPEGSIVLIHEDGTAGIHRLVGDRLQCDVRLGGTDWRVVAAPASDLARALRKREQRETARRLTDEIRDRGRRGDFQTLDTLHQKLSQLGYEHVSHALRAERARAQGDLLEELRARRSLAEMVTDDGPHTLVSLACYGALLESLWQPEAAAAIHKRIRAITPQALDSDRHPRHESVRDAESIVTPGIPIPLLIDAATIVGEPFRKRCCINELPALSCCGITLGTAEVKAKYEQVRAERAGTKLPHVCCESLWWLTPNQTSREETLVFSGDDTSGVPSLALAYRLHHDGLQTVVLTAVLFNTWEVRAGDSVHSHNSAVRTMYEQMSETAAAQTWCADVHRVVILTLRRLITEGLSHHGLRKEVHP